MEPTSTGIIVSALIGLLGGVTTLVVLPLLTYLQRRRDTELDRILARIDASEKRDAIQDVALTEIRGEIKTVAMVHAEIRDIRAQMLTREEFTWRIGALERELTPKKGD